MDSTMLFVGTVALTGAGLVTGEASYVAVAVGLMWIGIAALVHKNENN